MFTVYMTIKNVRILYKHNKKDAKSYVYDIKVKSS